MTTELGRLVNALCNAAIAYGERTEDSSSELAQEDAHSAMLEAEKALLDYLDAQFAFTKPTEEGFGQLVSELIKRTHECALAPDGYGCDAYLAQVAAEKALLEYVEKREAELAKLREGAERIAADYEGTGYKVTRELRALLK